VGSKPQRFYTQALVIGLLTGSLAIFGEAHAKPALIVAIGADNVYGHGTGRRNTGGVEPNEAFPAQLETLLRARGVDAHVVNAGIPRENTCEMLVRLDSTVPEGTRMVIVLPSYGNDKKSGVSKAEERSCMYKIEARLRARHIAFFVLKHREFKRIPGALAQRDDGHHWTVKGHAIVAHYLLPRVLAGLGGHTSNR
jgi:acyl-CoA thioesterase-1